MKRRACSLRCILAYLTIIGAAQAFTTSPRLNNECKLWDNHTLNCYVNCFADMLELLPAGTNVSQIEDLIFYQSSRSCQAHEGNDAIRRFKGLKKFHYTGLQCPFSELPHMPGVLEWSFMRSLEPAPAGLNFGHASPSRWNLSTTESFMLSELCCEFVRGVIFAPKMKHIIFNCPGVTARITGYATKALVENVPTDDALEFITPSLKRLEFEDRSAGFPVTSISNLTSLKSLFLRPCKYCLNQLHTDTSPNLTSLNQLTFTQEDFAVGSQTECRDLGAINLNQVTLIYPPISGIACPSVWQCHRCGRPSTDNDTETTIQVGHYSSDGTPFAHIKPNEQMIRIFSRSKSTTWLSSILPPGIQLNTTELIINYSPVLVIDAKSLARFPNLRRLQIGQIWGPVAFNGFTVFSGNPFTALPNPQKFHFLRVAFPNCGCLEYVSLAWLWQRNPTFQAEILCKNVTGADNGNWISIEDMVNRFRVPCEHYSIDLEAAQPWRTLSITSSSVTFNFPIFFAKMYAFLYLIYLF